MYTKLLDKQTKLALIGLGYVGLPIAMEFAKHVSVIGFDINEDRLDKLRNCIDPCGELPTEVFEHKDITFTSSIEKLREASFYVIAVPTPIDSHNEPDLSPLLGATRTVGKVLKRGDYVVYESTVYPALSMSGSFRLQRYVFFAGNQRPGYISTRRDRACAQCAAESLPGWAPAVRFRQGARDFPLCRDGIVGEWLSL